MRQSRRTNTGNRRNTLARRWRPWLRDEPLSAVEVPAVPTGGAQPSTTESPVAAGAALDARNRPPPR